VIVIATGSEVEIALEVAERLEGEGVAARVVSLPNWRRFEAQDEAYRESVLPSAKPEKILRVSIEAGSTFGWERLVMAKGLKFGLDGFGASAPAKDLYDHFGLTADKIVPQVLAALAKESSAPREPK
jgi:transketolase